MFHFLRHLEAQQKGMVINMKDIIQVSHLYKKYKTQECYAIHDINFTVCTGEIIGILGPNGAGKSTLIKMLLGVIRPTAGSVSVFGKDPCHFNNRDKTKIGVYLGGKSNLIYHLPVIESVRLFQSIYKVPKGNHQMSVSMSNLFNFSRALPEPFDKLTNKKVKVTSKYGSATEATLSCTMVKAVHAVCNCMVGTGEGAVGTIDHRTVAEYKSSAGPDMYHLVVFDSGSGNIMASIYDNNTEAIENYKLHQSAQDGAAVMMAMMPLLLKDDEFNENFQTYFDQRSAGYPDMKKATDAMAILCDNAYRRIKDDTCPAHIKVTLDKSGNVLRVSQGHLLSGVYTPTSVLAGEFTILAKTGKATVSAAKAAIDHRDFVGKYQLTGGRKLSILEESLVPKLEDWYIIPDQVVNICKHAQITTGKPMQMRNFLLRGPAGTGKTQSAMAIAAGLHLPYMKYTCSASTEVFDFVGMVFPNTDSLILIRCWHHIEDYIELCKKHQDEAVASGTGSSAGEVLSGLLQVIAGSSAEGTGSEKPVSSSEVRKGVAANAATRTRTQALARQNGSGGNDEKPDESEAPGKKENESGDSSSEENKSEEKPASNQADSDDSSGSDDVSTPLSGTGGDSQKQETTAEEGGRIPFHQTDSVSAPIGGSTEYDTDYRRKMNENAATDIERMLGQMAEKAACKQLETERLKELNEAAQSISYGDIHSGVNIQVHRIAQVDDELEDQFYQICGPLLDISKKLQRSLIQKLNDQQRGGKQTGLVMGRRLDAHALCRNDGKVFYTNNLPNEIPRISVGLLLDESGSMSCGDRSTYARAAAIILYDFCQSLNIPIMIYGHSTGWGADVDLYSYAEFDSIDRDDKFRLMDISARNSNRDGAALRFVAEQLSKRPEEIRILMLLSDGQPAARGYSGTAAEEDLRGIKQEYKRKGILFIAAAIGEDKPNIERIYGDSFLDITDLNQLPVKLTAVIKRFLR